MNPACTLVVGAGLAGSRCAETLRAEGYSGRIVVVGDEPHPPYERPALSKELLAGTRTDLELRPRSFWDEREIELRLGTRVLDLGLRGRTAETQRRADPLGRARPRNRRPRTTAAFAPRSAGRPQPAHPRRRGPSPPPAGTRCAARRRRRRLRRHRGRVHRHCSRCSRDAARSRACAVRAAARSRGRPPARGPLSRPRRRRPSRGGRRTRQDRPRRQAARAPTLRRSRHRLRHRARRRRQRARRRPAWPRGSTRPMRSDGRICPASTPAATSRPGGGRPSTGTSDMSTGPAPPRREQPSPALSSGTASRSTSPATSGPTSSASACSTSAATSPGQRSRSTVHPTPSRPGTSAPTAASSPLFSRTGPSTPRPSDGRSQS